MEARNEIFWKSPQEYGVKRSDSITFDIHSKTK